MPQHEQRDNDGVIFQNERKESDRHPDFTGKAMVAGVMYWVSSWTKEGRNGEFYTLSFKPMDEQQAPREDDDQRRQPARQQPGGYSPQPARRPAPSSRPKIPEAFVPEVDFKDDDIPF